MVVVAVAGGVEMMADAVEGEHGPTTTEVEETPLRS